MSKSWVYRAKRRRYSRLEEQLESMSKGENVQDMFGEE